MSEPLAPPEKPGPGRKRAPESSVLPKNVRRAAPFAESESAGAEAVAEKPSGGAPRQRGARGARRGFWRGLLVWTGRLTLLGVVLALVALAVAFAYVRRIEATLPAAIDLKSTYHPAQVTRVLARDGTLLAELFTERRTVVPIKSLPAHVKLAVLAAEDASFYEHEGLNYFGIARAFIVNLKAGRKRQGGSTITQQVVKNLILDSEKTYERKLREALLSRRIEQELTKDEILELYLNHIYFGHGRYGVEEAARHLFGKAAREISIAEAALLAGLPAGPELFSPRRDLRRSLTRRAFVLGQMREKGFLPEAAYLEAMAEPVHLAASEAPQSELAPEAVELARRMLAKVEPERSKRGGFVIKTTIDPKLQAAARKALREGLVAYDKRKGVVGPLKEPTPDKKGRVAKPTASRELLADGLPEKNKTYVGTVTGVDDVKGTIEVRLGAVTGVALLRDHERYNPQKLSPSAFAPIGSFVRVTALGAPDAPLAAAAPTATIDGGVADAGTSALARSKIPLRLELGPEGALVALDVRTRQIVALVGSYEAQSGGLDRATQAKRQPGSTFKPIVYAQALRTRRFTPASLLDVTPATFAGGYRPANYEGWKDSEPLRLREVLANSVNVAAVRVIEDVGPAGVVELARAMGIESTMKPDLSLALGSYEVSPMELAGAYATLAAGGLYAEPQVVLSIQGPDGAPVALPSVPPARRVLSEPEAFLTTSLLTSVVERGTGQKAKELGRPVAGKTGTSNGSKDTWFAGYSPDVASVVWIGFDDGNLLGRGETGGGTALPAWVSFMKSAVEGKAKTEFARPGGIVQVSIDKRTGLLPYDGDVDVIDELFLEGTEPKDVATPSEAAGADAGIGEDARHEALGDTVPKSN